nr:type II toxin-antitoxin system antitoxin SocA domain-containing protein [uncultured Cohaesibacter sp.]
MAHVMDVAAYILSKMGPMTAMKLQKLVYYSQAWALVWDEEPLFDADFEAWANGPVCVELYQAHRGCFKVSPDTPIFDRAWENKLSAEQIESIDAVLEGYGNKSAQWLSDLTHLEDPWKDARVGVAPLERSNAIISKASIAEYYSSIPNEYAIG